MIDFADRIYVEACPNSDYLWESDPSVFCDCDEFCDHYPHPTTVEYVRADLFAAAEARVKELEKDKARVDCLDTADVVVVEFGALGFSCFENESLRSAIDKIKDELWERMRVAVEKEGGG